MKESASLMEGSNYSDAFYEKNVFNVFLNGKCKWIEGTHLL